MKRLKTNFYSTLKYIPIGSRLRMWYEREGWTISMPKVEGLLVLPRTLILLPLILFVSVELPLYTYFTVVAPINHDSPSMETYTMDSGLSVYHSRFLVEWTKV